MAVLCASQLLLEGLKATLRLSACGPACYDDDDERDRKDVRLPLLCWA